MHMVATILNAGHCLLVNVDFCDIEGKDLIIADNEDKVLLKDIHIS